MTESIATPDTGAVGDQERPKRIFKIIVIGDSHVGKTCLTYRFCSGKFPEKTEATIGVDFREKTLEIDNEIFKLQIWDTAGQERFRRSMINHYYRNVHAIVYVYDVTNLASFENLPGWINECDKHVLDQNLPRVLVGNKCDVSPDDIVVPNAVAQRFADAHNIPLFETSAKADEHQDHVNSIFMLIAHKLKHSKPLMSQSKIYAHRDISVTSSPTTSNDASYCSC
ncbi:unnamed protein product [Adineta steineri]|uniref:Uncharacterized protein n=1 Tax=Adineta steineri TaxID=433720 RepID=A0A815JQD9_9BILA|nr:unnamed protein product [Adineta steineri]CAF1132593.1 unnamed protein product [Adineta steineri]CAF1204225.1 unnamed protein product [Adineta steineri]CAF1242440.1 unnamed protein product [Adineta steineri]CAF1383082.1 unnamed protein product [Adineta steineri]